MEEDNSCNTSLVLGIGQPQQEQNQPVQFHLWFPSHVNHLKRVGDDDNIDKNARKKLRLTKEQSSLLEDSFKEHKTLTMTQKQELAEQLNLQPRQVEVWFQNRRARSKLKQTEVDFEFLKKSCENLSKENQRLKNDLNELRSMKVGSPVLVQLPKEAARPLIMCPPCERVAADDRKTAKMDLYGAIEGSSVAFQKLCKLQTDK